MEDLTHKNECAVKVFENFLFNSVKVLKKLIETIETSDGYKLLQRENTRMNEMEEEILSIKNEFKKYARYSIVERDIRDIDSEFKAKFNKIQEGLTRIEKGTAIQVEKICQHIHHLRDRTNAINQIETQQLENSTKLDSITSELVQTGNEITWMKELHDELNIKVIEMLDDKKNIC